MKSTSKAAQGARVRTARAAFAATAILWVNATPSAGLQAAELTLPIWSEVFAADGSFRDAYNTDGVTDPNGVPDYVDLYDALDAVFIEDNLSDGVATDMSALDQGWDLSSALVYNGEVSGRHDLGNSYVMASFDDAGNLILYAGIERYDSLEKTYVEINFNQELFSLSQGSPWSIEGQRSDGDVRIRLNFINGNIDQVLFQRWVTDRFVSVQSASKEGLGCVNATPRFVLCTGAPPISGETAQLWNADFDPVEVAPADGFVEIGLNVGSMIGYSPAFSSILILTPEDIAIGTFRNMGVWAGLNAQ